MKCFIACFHKLKHRKRQKPRQRIALNEVVCRKPQPKQLINEKCEANEGIKPTNELLQPAEVITALALSNDQSEEQLNSSSRKKVTWHFDLDLESNECFLAEEAAECVMENKEKKEEESKDEANRRSDLTTSSSSFISYRPSDLTTSSSSFISYPLNHRHHDCTSSDEECEDIELNESELQDDVAGEGDEEGCVESDIVQEESSESLFSISIDSRKQVPSAADMGEKEVNSPLKPCYREMKSKELNQRAKVRSQCVDTVLNPVENLSQWKAVEVKAARITIHEGKENINLDQETILPFGEEPNLKQPIQKQLQEKTSTKGNAVAVDTSLSSWLVESEKPTDAKNNSPGSVCNSSESIKSSKRVQDRPILGALTVVDIKQLSTSSSSTQSPGRSPDDMLMVGTVGSFWRHTGQAIDSGSDSSAGGGHSGASIKGMELGEVSMHSTPFHARLDIALESGVV